MKKYLVIALSVLSLMTLQRCINRPSGGVSTGNLLAYSSQSMVEEASNTGIFDTTITVTLSGSEFVSSLAEGSEYGTTDLPDGLTVTVTRVSATEATIHIAGTATSHSFCTDGSMTFFFTADAFSDGKLPLSFELPITIGYLTPTLTYSATQLTESSANDGSFVLSFTITAGNGGAFSVTNDELLLDTDYTWEDIPAGLTPHLDVDVTGTIATVTFTGTATANTPNDDELTTALSITSEGLNSDFCASVATKKISFKMYRSVVMYSVSATSGDLGGRSGADALCYAGKPTLPSEYVNFEALISVNGADEIRDLAIPASTKIESDAGEPIADNFADLLDGSIDQTLAAADVLAASTPYWTGSTSVGGVAADTCNQWSSDLIGDLGQVGDSSSSNGAWLDDGTGTCDTANAILCVAYTN